MTISEKLSTIKNEKIRNAAILSECGFDNTCVLSSHTQNISKLILSCGTYNSFIDNNWKGMIFQDKNVGKIRVPIYGLTDGNILQRLDFYDNVHQISNVVRVFKTPIGKTKTAVSLFNNDEGQHRQLNSISSTNLTEIASQTFRGNSFLTSVYLPNVTCVMGLAFFECQKISSLYLPRLQQVNGSNAFYNLRGISGSVEFSNLSSLENSTNAFRNWKNCESISLPKANTIPNYTFYSSGTICKTNNEVFYLNIPNVSSIGEFSFSMSPDMCVDFRNRDTSMYSAVPILCGDGLSSFGKQDPYNYSRNISVFVPSAMYKAWIEDEKWLALSVHVNNEENLRSVKDRHFYILSS